jgi:hypothetical protein
VPGDSRLEVAQGWFAQVSRRRPQFKQVIQDIEHRGEARLAPRMLEDLRRAVNEAGLAADPERIAEDFFSTMRTELAGYRRMLWTAGSRDGGHWAEDPEDAREVALGDRFREANPDAEIRVVAYQTPLTHYGHIEKPRQLAGALLASVRWLMEVDED